MDIAADVSSILSIEVPLSTQEIIGLLETPPNETMGDLAFPCFSLSKILKQNPTKIANELQSKINIPKDSTIAKVTANGPYLNFFYNKVKLSEFTLKNIFDKKNKYGIQPENQLSRELPLD